MISHAVTGIGPPLILIHGSPGNGGMWKGVATDLAGRHTVWTVTLPDHDRPPQASYPTRDIEYFAAAVETLAATVGNSIGIVGHSFGGIVALRLALRGKASVDRVVLLEPVAIPALGILGQAEAEQEMRSVFDTYRRHHREGHADAAATTMIDFWFGAGAYAQMPDAVQTYIRDRNALTVRDVTAVLSERYTADGLAALAVPTLVVCGGASPAATRLITSTLASALGAGKLAVLDGADHALLTDRPREVADLIDRFVAR